MARTPFKLRSGNTTPFKQMGSSPVKDDGTKTFEQVWKTLSTEKKAKYGEGDAGFEKFKIEAEDWWKSEKGQEFAKANPKFKHRITKTDSTPPPSGNGDGNDGGNDGGDKPKNIIDKAVSGVGKIVEGIGKFISSPNIDVTTGKKPSMNIKESMDRKYGTGDYGPKGSKRHLRMLRGGESEFKYQQRMRKLKKKNPELFKTEE